MFSNDVYGWFLVSFNVSEEGNVFQDLCRVIWWYCKRAK